MLTISSMMRHGFTPTALSAACIWQRGTTWTGECGRWDASTSQNITGVRLECGGVAYILTGLQFNLTMQHADDYEVGMIMLLSLGKLMSGQHGHLEPDAHLLYLHIPNSSCGI